MNAKLTSATVLAAALRESCRGRVLENEPLSQHTTFGVGGPADLFFFPADAADLALAVPILLEGELPIIPLGGGTNTLAKDEGFRGVVVNLSEGLTDIEVKGDEARVDAGASTQVFSRRCQRAGRTGFEFACGIPGTIGGAVRGNAGAWGGETFDGLRWIRGVSLGSTAEVTLKKEEIAHSYRRVELPEELLVLEASFEVGEEDPSKILGRMEKMLEERREQQPLSMRNAGCVFKNPEGSAAGLLIDRSGCKGVSVSNVAVSDIHANFLVTKGGTTATDVLSLIGQVRQSVLESQGVELETEIRIIGEQGYENV